MSHPPGPYTAHYRSSTAQPAPAGCFAGLSLASPRGLSPTGTSRPAGAAQRSPPPPRLASSPPARPTSAVQRRSYTATSSPSFPRRADAPSPSKGSATPPLVAFPLAEQQRAPKAPMPLAPKEFWMPTNPSPPRLASSPTTAWLLGRTFSEAQRLQSSPPADNRQSPALPLTASAVQRSVSASPTFPAAGSPATASPTGSPAADRPRDRLTVPEATSPGFLTSRGFRRSVSPVSPRPSTARAALTRSPTTPQVARLGLLGRLPRHMSQDSSSTVEGSPSARSLEPLSPGRVDADAHPDPTPRLTARGPPGPPRAEAQLVMADDSLRVACPQCHRAFGTAAAAPLVLLCGHSMCRCCCNGAVANDEVACGACGVGTPLHGHGVDTLQTNYAVRGIHAVTLQGMERRDTEHFLEDIGASCLVCLEVYSDTVVPNVLACGHTICQACCARKLNACPLCNAVMQGLGPNRGLLKALEALVAVKRHGLDPHPHPSPAPQ